MEFRNHDSLDSSRPQDYIQFIDRRTELIDGCEGCNDEPALCGLCLLRAGYHPARKVTAALG